MEIRYKTIEHERTEDAPFVGALISAIGCDFKCKGCFHKDLKKVEDIVSTAEGIIAQIKANPFNQGVIFAGLEWSQQPMELVALIEEAVKNGLQIMIYTGCEIREFYARIGKGCSGKLTLDHELFDSEIMFELIGMNILNHYIPDDYYIKTGVFDREQLTPDREAFGVKLASGNQRIHLIKGGYDEGKSIN